MVPLMSLWLPILVSAALVFVASAIAHMVLPHHRTDLREAPDEDRIMDALRATGITPGDYVLPHANSSAEMQTPEYQEKYERGPVAMITIFPPGPPSMAKNLVQWFIYCIVVSLFAAYVAGRAVDAGGDYMSVFRFAGVTAFAGYALGQWQSNIWFGRSWSTTFKSNLDALAYALLTAGVFGWLWPAM